MALLAVRAREATICPSEVARALAAGAGDKATEEEWRDAMPTVHAAVDQMVAEGVVRLSWKGKTLPNRVGPYRISRGERT